MTIFPFTAISTQQQAKTALLLNCIQPSIGGVLLSGEKGTAKSTMVRSLAQLLPEKQVITLPLSITDDMLLGSIDMEKAVQQGSVEYQSGLLAKADGHILYIDEINLLSESVLNLILDAAASGICRIEREGISHSFPSRFILVASMNPEEGALRPQILDRFGFFVELKASVNERERVEIMKNRLQFEGKASAFYAKYMAEETALRQKIASARQRIQQIQPTDDTLIQIAQICEQAFIAGHRGDLALMLGAMAHAAFNDRKYITRADIATVQPLALSHRIRNAQAPPPEQNEQENEQESEQEPENNNQPEETPPQQNQQEQPQPDNQPQEESSFLSFPQMKEESKPSEQSTEEECFELTELKLNQDILTPKPDRRKRISGSGKRCKTRSGTRQGRYVKARIATGKVKDLAFDATLRAAAPFQQLRKKSGMALVVHPSDMREKVRERRIGNTVLFLVDASGSMGINRRMSEAKSAVLEMLKLSYTKRDVVGMMTFRQNEALMVLPPTRSVTKANGLLRDIKTGGRTPLSEGLRSVSEWMNGLLRKNDEIMPVVVIFSDGRANSALRHDNAMSETQSVAHALVKNGVRYIVVDTESGFLKLGLARKLANWLDADYFRLDDLKQHSIQSIINQ